MEVGEGRSSSNDLSSAPSSDVEGPFYDHPDASHSTTNNNPFSGGAARSILHGSERFGVAAAAVHSTDNAAPAATKLGVRQDAPVKQRKPRKKKDATVTDSDKKEKVPRKPRAIPGTTTTSRKKPKLSNLQEGDAVCALTNADLTNSRLVQPAPFLTPAATNDRKADEAAKLTQNGLLMHNDSMRTHSMQSPSFAPSTPKLAFTPRSSGIYDPVRSVTIQRAPEPLQTASTPQIVHTPPRPLFRPSASPAISSLVDPPGHERPSNAATTDLTREVKTPSDMGQVNTHLTLVGSAVEVEPKVIEAISLGKPSVGKSEAVARNTSPKPQRAKEQPPPVPAGSGLLSSSLFGGDSGIEAQSTSGKGPNIILRVDLKNPDNKVLNFARLAEEKYGFAALYPRQAAQRERLARVAAAGAALERSASGSKVGGSGAESADDDISVDIDRDSDNDGDIAMTGVNGGQEAGNSGTDGQGPKRRRKRKEQDYDQDDPFVDDSELLWEAQAAASKDGFFVYCGPLVPEGEKPAVERYVPIYHIDGTIVANDVYRADGSVKRGRGRGRGGGPGSRGGRGGTAAAAAAAADPGSGRGGGPGSRGGQITRKPRITKAERAQRDLEKANREKMATLAAKPTSYPA